MIRSSRLWRELASDLQAIDLDASIRPTMAVTLDEICRLHNDLIIRHGVEVIEIATTLGWIEQSTKASERVKHEHMKIVSRCAYSRLKELGVNAAQFRKVLEDVHRVNLTIDIINAIPD
ncbi:MAG: hypothetical protein ACK5OQ_16570 [Burkholderiales bacterium]